MRTRFTNKIDEVSPDLEVWAGDALGDLFEQRLLDLHKLSRLDDVEDFFDLSQEHHLGGKVRHSQERSADKGAQSPPSVSKSLART